MTTFTGKRLPRLIGLAIGVLLGATATLSLAQAPQQNSGIDLPFMDTSVRPQDDFYRFVNGKWLEQTVIPSDKGGYGAFNIVQDRTLDQLHAIIDELQGAKSLKDPEQRQIADLYVSFMNEAALVGKGVTPIQGELARIDHLADKAELAALMAHLDMIGVSVPFETMVAQDDKDSTHYAVNLGQSGLGLPDRDYYLENSDRIKAVRDQYPAHIQRLMRLAGDTHPDATATAVMAIESDLATIQWSRVDNRDPVKTYNRVDPKGLTALTSAIRWSDYLKALGYADKVSFLIVNQPSYLQGLNKVIATHDLASWKAYLRFRLISAYAPFLEQAFVDEAFAFNGTVIQGIPANRPRWKRGLSLVEAGMGEALGKIYVARHFPPEAKVRMDRLVDNLLAAYRADLDTLEWMGPETRQQAQKKLATFMPKIGYPAHWRDYRALQIKRTDLVGNVIRSRQFEHARGVAKLGKPVDRTEWMMTPQTINAYYNPTLNEIVFPAAILQPPFFNVAADDAVNYGGIGAVIGHEISHGFDDQGSQYGADGNLMGEPGWFTAADLEKFHTRTNRLVAQYDAQEPLPGHHVNGKLTLGENIADNSGLSIAYKAYRLSLGGKPSPVLDGFTGEQRLFIGWAQVWKSKSRDERTLMLLTTDPHSPGPIRGRVPLTDQDGFYDAFGIKAGDGMYLAPDQRVSIW